MEIYYDSLSAIPGAVFLKPLTFVYRDQTASALDVTLCELIKYNSVGRKAPRAVVFAPNAVVPFCYVHLALLVIKPRMIGE